MFFLTLKRTPFAMAALALAVASAMPLAVQAQASAPADTAAPAAVASDAALPTTTSPTSAPDTAIADTGSPSPVPEKIVVDNPYGFAALWNEGGWIARINLIIMLIMSMGSWYIIFTKLWEQHKLLQSARNVGESFWTAGSIQAGANTLEKGSAFRYIAESGLKASEHHEGTLVDHIDRHTWISMSVARAVENIQSRLSDGLAFLATVGSTAPFVGLFGTVWGIYGALTRIGREGQASIDKVAGPVGEALIMTAVGLAVAVPAVMGYNWLIRRNKGVMEKVRAFSSDLHNVLLAGKR